MNAIVEEIAHNLTGYVLLLLAVLLMVCGMKFNVPALADQGRALMDAALVALQLKRLVEAAGQPKTP